MVPASRSTLSGAAGGAGMGSSSKARLRTVGTQVAYRLYGSWEHAKNAGRALRGDAGRADLDGPATLRGARLFRRRHRGDRAGGGGDTWRSVPPLRREGRAVPGGVRADGGRAVCAL